MRAVFALSRLFEDTRAFLRAMAGSSAVSVRLVQGDAPAQDVLPLLRLRWRAWFEGCGPLLAGLLETRYSWAGGAVLRVAHDEVPRLPLPDLWRVVSDLVVPSDRAADTVRRASPLPERTRVHVVPPSHGELSLGLPDEAGEPSPLAQLAEILTTPPGDLPRREWQRLMLLGDACRGDVLVLGDGSQDCLAYLRVCVGCRVFTDPHQLSGGSADTVVFWENLRSADADRKLEEGLRSLKPGGALVAVAGRKPGPDNLTGRPLADRLSLVLGERGRVRCVAPDFVVAAKFPEAEAAAWASPPQAAPAADPGPGRIEVRQGGPMVTAAVPVYNDEGRVGRCIASLRRQSYPHLEILLVDDGSTDGTRQAIAQHLNDPRVRYLYKEHTGTPETRNLGVREARGSWIAWSGSDDESAPHRIAALVDAALADPGVDVVHSDGFMVLPDGGLCECRRYRPLSPEELPSLLLDGFSTVCPILDASAMVRKALYERIGYYHPGFRRCQDYDFYVRAALAGDVRFRHVPHPLIRCDAHLPRPEVLQIGLDRYLELSRKLIAALGEERLMVAAARDLHESKHVAMARELLAIGGAFKAPLEHPVFQEAQVYLRRALEEPGTRDRASACNLMGLLALYQGHGDRAAALFRQALELDPALVEAEMNLKTFGGKAATDDHLIRSARV